MEIVDLITNWVVSFLALKAVIIGSDFSFYLWYKHKQEYWKWYNSRETFTEHLEKINNMKGKQ